MYKWKIAYITSPTNKWSDFIELFKRYQRRSIHLVIFGFTTLKTEVVNIFPWICTIVTICHTVNRASNKVGIVAVSFFFWTYIEWPCCQYFPINLWAHHYFPYQTNVKQRGYGWCIILLSTEYWMMYMFLHPPPPTPCSAPVDDRYAVNLIVMLLKVSGAMCIRP